VGPNGVAQSVDFTYGEAQGVIAGISENSVLLKDNKVFSLSPTVAVVDQTGKQIALSDAPNNVPVRLRYSLPPRWSGRCR